VLLGFIDTLSERISGRPYAHMQAALDALDARVTEQLGLAMHPARRAGRVLGRGDQISSRFPPTLTMRRAEGGR
jgi:hypothetical protein